MTLETSSFPNGIDTSIVIDENAVEKTAAYTLVKDTDCGKIFYQKSAIVWTLPDLATGPTGQLYKIVNMGPDGTLCTINPNSNDGIAWKSDATANKDMINTAVTAKHGDYVVLSNVAASADYWQVVDCRGIWAKES
jgi:hypothetical protein